MASKDVIKPFHDEVMRLKSEGASLTDIAAELQARGVTVNRNAIDRYLKQHPPPPPPPPLPTPTSTSPRSQPVKTGRPEAKRPERVPQASDVPTSVPTAVPTATEGGVPAGALPQENPRGPEAQPPPETPQSWAPSAPQETPRPADAEVPLPPPPARARDASVRSVAELVVLAGEQARLIEAAKATGDPKKLRAALQASRNALIEAESKVPPEMRAMVQDALDQVTLQLSCSPESLLSGVQFQTMGVTHDWPPDLELLRFGENGPSWSLQDAFEGTLILGATGSGKTSGSGNLIARTFLNAEFGGLVLTVKEDECALWERYAASTGRTPQLCRIRPGGPFKFNFLDYQASLPEEHGGSTENVVELLHTILEAYSKGRRSSENFWTNTSRQILRNLVRVFKAAGAPLDLSVMRQFLVEAPQSHTDAEKGDWRKTKQFGRLLLAACRKSRGAVDEGTIDESYRYWTSDFPTLARETRSVVVTDFTSTVDAFFDPTAWDLFCGETTLTPEMAFLGAVIVVDLPVKKSLAIGRIAQIIWKHYFQLAVERRSTAGGDSRRPVFLWADEAQEFLTTYDAAFQATARSSRCATVYLSQNMPGFYVRVGGELPRERIDALVANLCTKILHGNNDPTTNTWAAEQIGKVLQHRTSVNTGGGGGSSGSRLFAWLSGKGGGEDAKSTASVGPVVDYQVQPSSFMSLKTGGPKNKGLVDAWFVKSGAEFTDGKHFFKATFQQEAR